MRYSVSSLRVIFCAVSLLLAVSGCSSVEFLAVREGLSPAPPPENATILGFIEWRGWGAMIFGFVPAGYVGAEDAAPQLLKAAKRIGADGVASVRVTVCKLPMPLSFIIWYRSVTASGIAYKFGGKKR